MEVYIGAIVGNKPVLLNSQGLLVRTLGSNFALSCVVEGSKAIVCQTDGVVKLYSVQGLALRQYSIPSTVKAVSASFVGSNQVVIPTSSGVTYTYTLDGQPLRIF